MNHYPQSPQSIGKLLDSGFTMYRHVLKPMLPLSFALGILAQVPQLLPYIIAGGTPDLTMGLTVGVGFLIWFVLYLALYNGWILSMDKAGRGEEPLGAGAAFGAGMGKLLPTIGAFILYMIAVTIGLVLLVIPGIILMVSLFFFWYLILLENQGAVSSLTNSHKLIWGNWWRTVTIVTVVGVVYMVAFFIVGFIAGIAMSASMFRNPTPEELAAGPGMAVLVFAGVQAVLNAFLLPMWNSCTLCLFRDLQLRKSGTDLAARAAAA